MAEATSETTRPGRPQYFKVPTPAPNGDATSAADQAPLAAKTVARLGIKSIEEESPPAKDPSDAIAEAADTVFKAIAARIAYHENHARRLRETCAAFATMSRPAALPAAVADGADEALLKKLVAMLPNLKPEEGFP